MVLINNLDNLKFYKIDNKPINKLKVINYNLLDIYSKKEKKNNEQHKCLPCVLKEKKEIDVDNKVKNIELKVINNPFQTKLSFFRSGFARTNYENFILKENIKVNRSLDKVESKRFRFKSEIKEVIPNIIQISRDLIDFKPAINVLNLVK